MIRVLLATNEPVLAEGIQTILSDGGLKVVAVCSDVCELFESVHRTNPEIAIVDLPVLPRPEVIRELRRMAPKCQFVLWPRPSAWPELQEAVAAGARGVLTAHPSPARILEAMNMMADFAEPAPKPATVVNSTCNAAEKQCLALAGYGLNSQEIAAVTKFDSVAVEQLMQEVSRRLGAGDRYELALYGLSTLKEAN